MIIIAVVIIFIAIPEGTCPADNLTCPDLRKCYVRPITVSMRHEQLSGNNFTPRINFI